MAFELFPKWKQLMNHRRTKPRQKGYPERGPWVGGWRHRLEMHDDQPTAILTDWTDSEPEDTEAADDKRQLKEWSDYLQQSATMDDYDPFQEWLHEPLEQVFELQPRDYRA